MFKAKIRKSAGQSLSEYVIFIGVVSAALMGMQTYVKRGIQAVVKTQADAIGSQKDSEELDPELGTLTDSRMTTKISNQDIVSSSKSSGDQATGPQRLDIDRESVTSGSASYKSRSDK